MIGWRSFAVVLAGVLVVTGVSIRQYDFATRVSVRNSSYQCGHMVLLRATQLAGIPIGPETLRELPYRREGVSLGELETALDDIGFDAEIEFGHDPTRLPELSICKLDSPDHFVLVQPLGDNFLKIYSGKGRYELVGTNEFSERFSGYYLRLTAKMNPVQYISSSNGPMPQFETLLIDTGKLNYKDYVNKPVAEQQASGAGWRLAKLLGE